ncbi:MORN repeat containing [Perkinsus chesapeaki]|uniref:MORN repeat-containing protein 3 n=1 Tax=Perkinsus chesapeaki TaxID=330153 RepID=A0A7J6MSD6_PERCH|nr:MORN repeat containing [Perkinsus chesapeaki]
MFAGVPRRQEPKRIWRENWKLSEKDAPKHKTVFWTSIDKSGAKTIGCKAEDRMRYAALGSYVGGWKNNKKDGYGTRCSVVAGSRYDGEWKEGMRHGEGMQWVKCRKGKGVRKSYAGSWVNDKREGFGTGYFEDGSSYQGNWIQGRREGEGTMFYANGDIYRGQWRQGKRSGTGTLIVGRTGDLYEGQWLNDRKEGPGRYYYRSRKKVMDGEWAEDMCTAGLVTPYEDDIELNIPPLRLEGADELVQGKLDEIKSNRFLFRVLNTPLPDLFDATELDIIRSAHEAATSNSSDGTASILSLRGLLLSLLGIQLVPEELWGLCVTVGAITQEQAEQAVLLTEAETRAPPESSLPTDNDEVIERVVDDLVDDDEESEGGDDEGSREIRDQYTYRHFILPKGALTVDRCARMISLISGTLGPGTLGQVIYEDDEPFSEASSVGEVAP